MDGPPGCRMLRLEEAVFGIPFHRHLGFKLTGAAAVVSLATISLFAFLSIRSQREHSIGEVIHGTGRGRVLPESHDQPGVEGGVVLSAHQMEKAFGQ